VFILADRDRAINSSFELRSDSNGVGEGTEIVAAAEAANDGGIEGPDIKRPSGARG
jgi:hypothetical protein